MNDEVLFRAGFENQHYVLTCCANFVRRKIDESEELYFDVGGLNGDQHFKWLTQNLKLGDKLSFRVITDNFDDPTGVPRMFSEEDILKNKIRHFYSLKEELKDYLDNG